MGAIKDLVDLVTQLSNSVQDRKFAEELRQIQSMIGSIQSEQAERHEQCIRLMTENAELKKTISSLQEEIGRLKIPKMESSNILSDEEKGMLIILSKKEGITSEQIASYLKIDPVKSNYWVEELTKKNLIRTKYFLGKPPIYFLAQNGRKFLIENKLI